MSTPACDVRDDRMQRLQQIGRGVAVGGGEEMLWVGRHQRSRGLLLALSPAGRSVEQLAVSLAPAVIRHQARLLVIRNQRSAGSTHCIETALQRLASATDWLTEPLLLLGVDESVQAAQSWVMANPGKASAIVLVGDLSNAWPKGGLGAGQRTVALSPSSATQPSPGAVAGLLRVPCQVLLSEADEPWGRAWNCRLQAVADAGGIKSPVTLHALSCTEPLYHLDSLGEEVMRCCKPYLGEEGAGFRSARSSPGSVYFIT
ncbi:hypothetical protein [Motiliproteus sediminis]|uniref:hypothetical protein n=1 Tax=Motiliproteus sediminis TaxID=1468178 RepID=UPI001AEFD70B|nr:hypothetical protein [Motiliproteus sediminis]